MIDRRQLSLGAGGLLLAGCAGPLARPQVEVVAGSPPADAAQPPGDAQLQTGADSTARITAPVMINGQGPFDFVVDTGANRTVISAALAERLDLPQGPPANIHGVAGVEPAPTVLINRLDADLITARNLRAPALAQDRLGAAGLLGVDVLHDRRVLINFVERKLTISTDRPLTMEASAFDLKAAQTGSHADLGPRVVVPARYRFGQLIIIGADVSGRKVVAFVDSGAQSTVGNNALRRIVAQTSPTAPAAARFLVPVLSATGQTAQGEMAVMPLLRIGGLDITGLNTVFADLHVFEIWDLMSKPSLLLGMDILSRFSAIELNYARREVAFYLPGKSRAG